MRNPSSRNLKPLYQLPEGTEPDLYKILSYRVTGKSRKKTKETKWSNKLAIFCREALRYKAVR